MREIQDNIITENGRRYSFTDNDTIKEKSLIRYNTPSSFAKANLFYLDMYGSFVCESQYRIERESFDSYLIMYTKEGEGIIQTNCGKSVCRAGDFALIDCNEYHLYYANNYWEFLWFHFNGNGSHALVSVILQNQGNVVRISSASMACHMFEQMVNTKYTNSLKKEVEISSYIHVILSEMLQASAGEDKKEDNWITDAVSYICDHFSEKLTVEGVAEHLNISKSSFCHTFKRKMGFSPYEFIVNIRINKGKELLKSSSMSIGNIAYLVGFNSEANFIKTFREKTGQTPNTFRKNKNVPSDFQDVFFGKKLYSVYADNN